MEDAGFEPRTSVPEVWCVTNKPPNLFCLEHLFRRRLYNLRCGSFILSYSSLKGKVSKTTFLLRAVILGRNDNAAFYAALAMTTRSFCLFTVSKPSQKVTEILLEGSLSVGEVDEIN